MLQPRLQDLNIGAMHNIHTKIDDDLNAQRDLILVAAKNGAIDHLPRTLLTLPREITAALMRGNGPNPNFHASRAATIAARSLEEAMAPAEVDGANSLRTDAAEAALLGALYARSPAARGRFLDGYRQALTFDPTQRTRFLGGLLIDWLAEGHMSESPPPDATKADRELVLRTGSASVNHLAALFERLRPTSSTKFDHETNIAADRDRLLRTFIEKLPAMFGDAGAAANEVRDSLRSILFGELRRASQAGTTRAARSLGAILTSERDTQSLADMLEMTPHELAAPLAESLTHVGLTNDDRTDLLFYLKSWAVNYSEHPEGKLSSQSAENVVHFIETNMDAHDSGLLRARRLRYALNMQETGALDDASPQANDRLKSIAKQHGPEIVESVEMHQPLEALKLSDALLRILTERAEGGSRADAFARLNNVVLRRYADWIMLRSQLSKSTSVEHMRWVTSNVNELHSAGLDGRYFCPEDARVTQISIILENSQDGMALEAARHDASQCFAMPDLSPAHRKVLADALAQRFNAEPVDPPPTMLEQEQLRDALRDAITNRDRTKFALIEALTDAIPHEELPTIAEMLCRSFVELHTTADRDKRTDSIAKSRLAQRFEQDALDAHHTLQVGFLEMCERESPPAERSRIAKRMHRLLMIDVRPLTREEGMRWGALAVGALRALQPATAMQHSRSAANVGAPDAIHIRRMCLQQELQRLVDEGVIANTRELEAVLAP